MVKENIPDVVFILAYSVYCTFMEYGFAWNMCGFDSEIVMILDPALVIDDISELYEANVEFDMRFNILLAAGVPGCTLGRVPFTIRYCMNWLKFDIRFPFLRDALYSYTKRV